MSSGDPSPKTKTVCMLLTTGVSALTYTVLFALKRLLLPADIVLTEGLWLFTICAPVVIAVAIALCRMRWVTRDGAIATCMIFALAAGVFNLTVPAIFDRSVTVYLINTLENNPQGMTETNIRDEFIATYLGKNHGVTKRLDEQIYAGNIVYEGERYRITSGGRRTIMLARIISKIYRLDQEIVKQK